MAEVPSRAEIEAALEWWYDRARALQGYRMGLHAAEQTVIQVAEAWLAALDGPTVRFDAEGTYGMTDYAEVVFDGETAYVLVKKEDR